MAVEKDQVAFVVRASGLTGPVGNPILIVSAVLERDRHELVFYRGLWGEMRECERIRPAHVPLDTYDAEILAAVGEGNLRAAMVPAFGMQLQVDLLDP